MIDLSLYFYLPTAADYNPPPPGAPIWAIERLTWAASEPRIPATILYPTITTVDVINDMQSKLNSFAAPVRAPATLVTTTSFTITRYASLVPDQQAIYNELQRLYNIGTTPAAINALVNEMIKQVSSNAIKTFIAQKYSFLRTAQYLDLPQGLKEDSDWLDEQYNKPGLNLELKTLINDVRVAMNLGAVPAGFTLDKGKEQAKTGVEADGKTFDESEFGIDWFNATTRGKKIDTQWVNNWVANFLKLKKAIQRAKTGVENGGEFFDEHAFRGSWGIAEERGKTLDDTWVDKWVAEALTW